MIESDHVYGLDEHHPKARRRPRRGARLRGVRAGLRCQRRVVQHRTSCPNHLGYCRQGMSKGPTTVEGRRRISDAQRKRWARWREAKGSRRTSKTQASRQAKEASGHAATGVTSPSALEAHRAARKASKTSSISTCGISFPACSRPSGNGAQLHLVPYSRAIHSSRVSC